MISMKEILGDNLEKFFRKIEYPDITKKEDESLEIIFQENRGD